MTDLCIVGDRPSAAKFIALGRGQAAGVAGDLLADLGAGYAAFQGGELVGVVIFNKAGQERAAQVLRELANGLV